MALFKKNQQQSEQQNSDDNAQSTDISQSKSTKAWAYSIVKSPRITEKTYTLFQNNVYTFEVAQTANKKQVKKAVEALFDVPVTSVRIINVKPQNVSFQQQFGTTKSMKKALVSVQTGYSISL
ncbi:MAG: 50S ribosomal protein L23 [Candidatus Paceibacteria bacterium]